MIDTEATYQNKDLMKMFSTVSDSHISTFYLRGLSACKVVQKNIRKIFYYTALQCVHIGVVSQLSLYGQLLRAEDTIVKGLDGAWFSLKNPDELVKCYREAGPDVILAITLTEMPVEKKDKRLRTSRTIPRIIAMKSGDLGAWVQKYNQQQGNTDWMYDPEDTNWRSDWYKSFGFLIIDVERIIKHVYQTLEITHLLK